MARPLGAWMAALCFAGSDASAQGHGPSYTLATPTLGRGGWSVDLGVMNRFREGKDGAMSRTMLSYGITEDLQLSFSIPVALRVSPGLPPARAMARMPAVRDLELAVGYRFHRRATAVGTRFESTAWGGFEYPTDEVRAGLETTPGFFVGAVTGYASRAVYVWAGGLYRRYFSVGGGSADRGGDLAMYTVAVGYRPPDFQQDSRPDWRAFIELVGEVAAHDTDDGVRRPESGGHRLFVGPTLLGLFGRWGISGGPLFPIHQRLNGNQPKDRARLVVNLTYWIF